MPKDEAERDSWVMTIEMDRKEIRTQEERALQRWEAERRRAERGEAIEHRSRSGRVCYSFGI